MSAADRFFIPEPTTFGEPPVDVTELYKRTAAYVVTALDQEMRIRPRDQKLIPTIAVSFGVPGLPGTFTIRIDNYAFGRVDVLEYMYRRSYLIRGLYALPETLPPFVYLPVPLTWPHVSLDSLSAATQAGQPALAWAGSIDTQNLDTSYHLEVTRLRDADPWLVTDPVSLPAAAGSTAVSGVVGPLDPGSYTAQLLAANANGLGQAGRGPVTV